MVGYLDITVGPMFSGKTKKLIRTYRNYEEKNIVAINHSLDTRYMDNAICSHDLDFIPCIMIDNIYDVWYDKNHVYHDMLERSSHILINEAQFFDRLCEVVVSMLKCGKKVFIYGLDGDFQQEKFGEILDLIPHCDTIEKLRGFCNNCDNRSIYTKRLEENNKQVVIGNDNYAPRCRRCNNVEMNIMEIQPVD